jgi:hypothetical protein
MIESPWASSDEEGELLNYVRKTRELKRWIEQICNEKVIIFHKNFYDKKISIVFIYSKFSLEIEIYRRNCMSFTFKIEDLWL